jgi:hypothetical protein
MTLKKCSLQQNAAYEIVSNEIFSYFMGLEKMAISDGEKVTRQIAKSGGVKTSQLCGLGIILFPVPIYFVSLEQ